MQTWLHGRTDQRHLWNVVRHPAPAAIDKVLLGRIRRSVRGLCLGGNCGNGVSGNQGKGKKSKAILKERVVPKLFLRGDSVILAVKNPR